MNETLNQPALRNPYREVQKYRMLIGGQWVDAEGGGTFTSLNPTTGEVWAEVPDGQAGDVDSAVVAARRAFEGEWGGSSPADRAAVLRRAAAVLSREDVIERLAVHEVLDTGKVIREAAGLARAFSSWCNYFAGLAESLRGATIPVSMPDTHTYTVKRPLGVVAAIAPWNSPLMLTLWKVIPALAAGNTVVVKPSEVAPASTLELAKVLDKVGLPPGVLNVVSGGREAGAALAAHPGVAKIAFTGSTATGIKVMKAAADNLTQVSLELGGKSPNIIFGDADLERAVNGIVSGVFAATGQMCTAGSRVLIENSVYDPIVDLLLERVRQIKIGDPFDWSSDIGALTWDKQRDRVLGLIADAEAQGAAVLHRALPDGLPAGGFHVPPTIFGEVDNAMPIAREEIFGPVAALIRFDGEAEAIEIANDTRYGLAAAVWTNDLRRAYRMTAALEAGTVWVNCYRRFSYAVPFGGVKASGFGRENGLEVMDEYTETKSVWVDVGTDSRDAFRLT